MLGQGSSQAWRARWRVWRLRATLWVPVVEFLMSRFLCLCRVCRLWVWCLFLGRWGGHWVRRPGRGSLSRTLGRVWIFRWILRLRSHEKRFGIGRGRPAKQNKVSICMANVKRQNCTMVMVNSCFKEVIVFRRRTTSPPPSTVSMVRARRLGVIASKSCKTHMPYVFPRILCDSL